MAHAPELLKQIEAAYDYRGHVSIVLKDGKTLEGFVFNRIKKSPRVPDGDYIDVMVKDSEQKRRLRFDELASIGMSGKNFAETFAEHQARTAKG
ncbi:MAG: hypothetical protein HYZ75_16345 [Elusimicrobia bacterium]|nr:hypothetical protein [Elusimicrobiota bacterium]